MRVPGACLLGGKEKLDAKLAKAREGIEDGGEKQPAMATFESTRPAVGAPWPSASPAPPTSTPCDYAKERQAFGKPIIMNQAIAFMLADMATEIDASRLLVWRAAWLANNGGYTNAEGSMCKLKAGRTATWVTERAIQILGGYGYVREYPVERFHRDAKIMRHLRRHRADPAARHRPGHQRPAHRVGPGARRASARRTLRWRLRRFGALWKWDFPLHRLRR